MDVQARRIDQAPGLLDRFAVPAGAYDELRQGDGQLRAHWAAMVQALGGLGHGELDQRWSLLRRELRESRIASALIEDGRQVGGQGDLDLLPFVISEPEWRTLERGLIQRGRLLSALLDDLYGPQTVLQRGLVPPGAVFGNRAFLRPAHGLKPPGGSMLHMIGVDLGRAANGTWHVLGQVLPDSVGPGFALENRIAISHALSQPYREQQIRRLAPWFEQSRQALASAATCAGTPRLALLTPGPGSPNYHEDAFLARYLGFSLIRGDDVTVRDNRIYLKTLGGLEALHAIWRRIPDDLSDPLELNGGSTLGIPGLLQAVRAGHMAVGNAIGAGLAESLALFPYLPALAPALIGEDLLLPQPEALWCGAGPAARVSERLADGEWLYRRAMPAERRRRRSDDLRAGTGGRRPEASPELVAVRPFALSHAPSLNGAELSARPVTLRMFLAWTEDGFSVMPGAIARVGASLGEGEATVSGYKDTWVLSSRPVGSFSLMPPVDAVVEIRRSGNQLPSRVADDLFWLGRYLERAEIGVRSVRAALLRAGEDLDPAGKVDFASGLHHLQQMGQLPEVLERGPRGPQELERSLLKAMLEANRPGSLSAILNRVRLISISVQDRLSLDIWRALAQLKDQVDDLDPRQMDSARLLPCLHQMVTTFSALSGMGTENMMRGPAWLFLDLGRRIERALGAVTMIRSTVLARQGAGAPALDLALELADSTMTYRARYRASPQLAPILDLLIADEDNPRSLAYQVARTAGHVARLPRGEGFKAWDALDLGTRTIMANLREIDANDLARPTPDGKLDALEALMDDLDAGLPALSDLLGALYFTHALVRPAIGMARRGSLA
ncbi:circularly permuted type 2 ATP-grasp protein [Zavarzinia sp. CC-PAN008]|uniref:circularly permuted type 2 ATP-grasp protein n=1 Tax=Zavarzinia sp. CC-PAN008 TaxID=3243332 RepID=UPI003F7438A0